MKVSPLCSPTNNYAANISCVECFSSPPERLLARVYRRAPVQVVEHGDGGAYLLVKSRRSRGLHDCIILFKMISTSGRSCTFTQPHLVSEQNPGADLAEPTEPSTRTTYLILPDLKCKSGVFTHLPAAFLRFKHVFLFVFSSCVDLSEHR